jgi:hypothetical protein
MDMDLIRDWLIQQGVSPEELDKHEEPKALSDIGNAILFTLQNDNQIADLTMSLFMQVNDLAGMVIQLQTELEELKNGNA